MLVLIEAVSERIFSIQCFCRVSKYDFLSVEEKKNYRRYKQHYRQYIASSELFMQKWVLFSVAVVLCFACTPRLWKVIGLIKTR